MFESLHSGIKRRQCVLSGVKLTPRTLMFQMEYAREIGGILSPKLFAIYVDDLSHELTLCKSGCYIDDQCMNHVMYADDICLMAPSAIGLQKMLAVCFDFSLRNDMIMFNPVKSVRVTFKPKNSKLSCQSVRLDCNILKYISQTKYYAQDDEDMLRQMRTLYM